MRHYLTLTCVITSTICATSVVTASAARTSTAAATHTSGKPTSIPGPAQWAAADAERREKARAFLSKLQRAAHAGSPEAIRPYVARDAYVNFITIAQKDGHPSQEAQRVEISKVKFEDVFTPTIIGEIQKADPEQVFKFQNAQGFMLGGGAVWFRPDGIFAVNISKPE